jgi:hypothetical protein
MDIDACHCGCKDTKKNKKRNEENKVFFLHFACLFVPLHHAKLKEV